MGLTIVSPILNFCTYYSTSDGVCQELFFNLFLISLHTRQGFVASFTSPIWHSYCSTFCAVCQEVSQTFYTNYYPDLTDNLLFVDSIYLSAKNASRIVGSIKLTFAFNVWLYNVVYYVYFLYFLQGRAPSDFLGYSLLTLFIVAHFALLVKRFSRKNSWIFSFIPCVPLRRDLNVIGERSIATSNRSPTPTCGSGVSLLTLSIIADCPRITIDKITKLREKIFFIFVRLFSWQNWRGVV